MPQYGCRCCLEPQPCSYRLHQPPWATLRTLMYDIAKSVRFFILLYLLRSIVNVRSMFVRCSFFVCSSLVRPSFDCSFVVNCHHVVVALVDCCIFIFLSSYHRHCIIVVVSSSLYHRRRIIVIISSSPYRHHHCMFVSCRRCSSWLL
jgi:hypothetical protein